MKPNQFSITQVFSHLLILALPLMIVFSSLIPAQASWATTESSRFKQGVEAYEQGNYQAAIDALNEAIQQEVEQPDRAYYLLGISHLKLGELDQAIADYSKVIELNPDKVRAYYDRAVAKTELGNYEQAVADYDRAIELAPNNETIYLNRGIAKMKQGKLQQAIADYTQAIELNSELGDAYANRGITKAALGNKDDAITDLETAAELYQNQGKQELYQTVQDSINKLK